MYRLLIGLIVLLLGYGPPQVQAQEPQVALDFYGDTLFLTADRPPVPNFQGPPVPENIRAFLDRLGTGHEEPVVAALLDYRQRHHPDDWLYYQLIRRVAQYITPKEDNYLRYTLYKYFLLTRSGYGALLSVNGDRMLFYVRCDEPIYDIPSRLHAGRQYVCLNYHDYGGNIDFDKEPFEEVKLPDGDETKAFSYRLTQLPDFTATDYQEKDLAFTYHNTDYHFRVKLTPQVNKLLANYPVADYSLYFNTPLSRETYRSLIPQLKNNVAEMSVRNGVDYLMRFTRYAFLYESDTQTFGKEKRLAAEQTLLSPGSDCEDRAALFFCLVKEIYHLPMIVLVYPQHVAIAVRFDKPVGTPIIYQGIKYSVCEPTPQKNDLPIGRLSRELSREAYEIGYVYHP